MSKYVVLGFEKFIYLDGLNSCRNNDSCNYYMCSLCGYLLVRKNEWFKFVTEVLTRESKKKWKRKIIKMKMNFILSKKKVIV